MDEELAQGASFDPRTWVTPGGAPAERPPPQPDVPRTVSLPPITLRQRVIAAGIGIALLLAGAAVAWSQRVPPATTSGAAG